MCSAVVALLLLTSGHRVPHPQSFSSEFDKSLSPSSTPCSAIAAALSPGGGLALFPRRRLCWPQEALKGYSPLLPAAGSGCSGWAWSFLKGNRAQSNPSFLAENIANSLLRIKSGCVQENMFRHPLFSVSCKQALWDNNMLNNVSYRGLLPEWTRFRRLGNLNIFRL